MAGASGLTSEAEGIVRAVNLTFTLVLRSCSNPEPALEQLPKQIFKMQGSGVSEFRSLVRGDHPNSFEEDFLCLRCSQIT